MQEKVFFDGKFGKICGILEKVQNSSEIVIIVHVFSSNKNTSAVLISKRLIDAGFSTLRIDLDNKGESELEFANASVSNYVLQVEAAINYCFNELGFEKVSLVGGSFGGLVSLVIASLHPELNRVFLRCPGAGFYYRYLVNEKREVYEEAKKRGFIEDKHGKFSVRILEDLEKYYPLFKIAKEIKVPVGVIHGDKDETINYLDTVEFCKYIKNVRLHIIKGAGHNLKVNNDASEGLDFLEEFFRD